MTVRGVVHIDFREANLDEGPEAKAQMRQGGELVDLLADLLQIDDGQVARCEVRLQPAVLLRSVGIPIEMDLLDTGVLDEMVGHVEERIVHGTVFEIDEGDGRRGGVVENVRGDKVVVTKDEIGDHARQDDVFDPVDVGGKRSEL